MSRTARRGRAGVTAIVAGALACACVGWALATVFAPRADVVDATSYTYVRVVEGQVGSTVALNASAAWSSTRTGINRAVGTITTILIEPGQQMSVGASLYSVDLTPVVIGAGAIPSFRSLAEGSTGADVAQLQDFLAGLGFYEGEIDGSFGSYTASAVEAWQKDVGAAVDGEVDAGSIIFVAALPARITLDPEKVFLGATLGGGEQVVSSVAAEPAFTIQVSAAQSTLISDGTNVELTGPDGDEWRAVVAGRAVEDDGSITLSLAGADGSVCADRCATVPLTGQAVVPASVTLVAPATGLVVPSAALVSRSAGGLVVVDGAGGEHPVSVIASARGMSVITGVPDGLMVRIPGTEDGS